MLRNTKQIESMYGTLIIKWLSKKKTFNVSCLRKRLSLFFGLLSKDHCNSRFNLSKSKSLANTVSENINDSTVLNYE